MGIVPIFVDDNTGEGLYSFVYDGNLEPEYDRIMNLWSNVQYVSEYFLNNLKYLKDPFFDGQSLDSLISLIYPEVLELDDMFQDYNEAGFGQFAKTLQQIFRPLFDDDYRLSIYQSAKTSVQRGRIKLLRIYAIRMGPNAYVITGGSIKLTKKMQDHPDSNKELEKLEFVRRYLKSNNFLIEDDLKDIL